MKGVRLKQNIGYSVQHILYILRKVQIHIVTQHDSNTPDILCISLFTWSIIKVFYHDFFTFCRKYMKRLVFFFACFLSVLHCRKSFLVLGTVEINKHEKCDWEDWEEQDVSNIIVHEYYDGPLDETRWISRTFPLSQILISSLQKSSSLSLSWETDSLMPSKEKRELKGMLGVSDSGAAERDWKKHKSNLITSTLHTTTCFVWFLLTFFVAFGTYTLRNIFLKRVLITEIYIPMN